ncbi:putative GTP-binding protein 6 [Bacillus rossius redtenbacheri]|uniref:putative GTP-binding protein 6 n=1 Tax=Bacillus rossius redtenbacheri TaxID=93214 RepID=UPI002FDD5690
MGAVWRWVRQCRPLLGARACSGDAAGEDTEQQYEQLARRVFHPRGSGEQVLVLQPYVKWGRLKRRNTTPQLQLAEAVALVSSLPRWRVVSKMTVPLMSLGKKTLFGKGNLESLHHRISKDERITAVFVSVDMLTSLQHRELAQVFGVTIYDRYMIVIQIFRDHACTAEAKLQVAMAEIHYLRLTLRTNADWIVSIGQNQGSGELPIESRRKLISVQEKKVKEEIQKLSEQRQLLRKNRRRLSSHPVVAVVGYTNAGKTSLIRALTGEEGLQPKDQLFATLDVTLHEGVLPSGLKVLYVDTIGFISDMPAGLIHAFHVTLEDALLADVIVHVKDLSHPDMVAQTETVQETLQSLQVQKELVENLVVVGNKTDLAPPDALRNEPPDTLQVSATTHRGLTQLCEKLEQVVVAATNRMVVVMKVPMGGAEAAWLYKEATVVDVKADEDDMQCMLMKVVISRENIARFRRYFIEN